MRDIWRNISFTTVSIAQISIIGVVVGGLSASFALAFIYSIHHLNDLLFISTKSRFLLLDRPTLLALLTVIVPTLGGLIAGLLISYLSHIKRPIGPADAIYSVQYRDISVLKFRDGLATTIGAMLALGFGASVGQYGPVVTMGAVIGTIAKKLKMNVKHVITIGIACGVAAAISAAFNAPIAGIIFAHEAIVRHYSLKTFAPVTVASTIGYILANVVFEMPPFFEISFTGVEYGYEFLLFIVLGLFSAGLAYWFMQTIIFFTNYSNKIKKPYAFKTALAGFILGIVAIFVPEVLSIGKEVLRLATIEGAFIPVELVTLIAVKIILTALCLGFGIPGGVFSPALLVGVLWGALFSSIISALGIANSGVIVYAVAAMMAVASPVVGAPLTMILIVFELTRSYDITIAAMVAVVFSNLIANRIFARSFFDMQLQIRGMNLSKGRDRAVLSLEPILPYAEDPPQTLNQKTTINDAIDYLVKHNLAEVSVICKDNCYVGKVTLVSLLKHQKVINNKAESTVKNTIASSQAKPNGSDISAENTPEYKSENSLLAIVDKNALVFYRNTSIWLAMNKMKGYYGDYIAIVNNKEDRQLIGQISEGQIMNAYYEATKYMREEENAI